MQFQPPDDLDWLAFCYIAGELPPNDAEAFETRLADDQAAREAVARAVELTFTLAAGAEVPQQAKAVAMPAQMQRQTGRGRRWLWSAVAAAACLAVFWSVRWVFAPQPHAGPSEELAGEVDGVGFPKDLAVLWNHVREEWAGSPLDDSLTEIAGPDEAVEPLEELLPAPADDLLATCDPPAWMLAAVRAGDNLTGPGSSSNVQEN